MIVWIAVDPGGRDTGGVLRTRGRGTQDELLGWIIKTSTAPARELPTPQYVWDVVDWVGEEKARAESLGHTVRIAVESVVKPSRRRGARSGEVTFLDPATLIGVSMIYSAIITAFRDAVVVRPASHGQAPLRDYPKLLVGAREKAGGGILRHCRSAWDVAGTAMVLDRHPALGLR